MSKRAFLLIVGVLSTPFLLGDMPMDGLGTHKSKTRSGQQEDCTRPGYVMDRTQRITAKHREGNGIGYQTGYTSLEGFFSTSKTPNLLGFADVRAHVFNDSKKAYNLGVGLRGLSEPLRVVFGANVFYDYRDARHRAFNQIGVGLEVLSRKWDLRANGYIPVHNTKKKYRDEFLKFTGNSAVFSKRYEFAFIGAELALGRELVKMKYWDLHAKLAGYWFNGEFGKNAGGGLFELSTNITRYLTLKGQASYDTLFRGIFQGEAAINVPFGWKFEKRDSQLSCTALKDLEDRLVETVDRFEMIVTSIKRKKAVAVDPLTGQPLTFIFVNNTSHSLGTFESPYPTLAQAITASQPNNVIYVFPGDGTTTGMSTGPYTLQNNQKLIGSAAPLAVTTAFGGRTIPAQTLNRPSVTTASGNVIMLANNNTVAGLTITSISGSAGVQANTITGASIYQNNFIQSASENSIDIATLTGNIVIRENLFQGIGSAIALTSGTNATGLINRNIFACAAGAGNSNITVRLRASSGTGGGTQAFALDSNVFIPPATGGSSFTAIDFSNVANSAANVKLSISNNVILNPNLNPNFLTGINLSALGTGSASTFKGIINKNEIANVQGNGINAQSSLSISTFEIDSNSIVNNNLNNGGNTGMLVGYLGGATSPMTVRVADNISLPAFGATGITLEVLNSMPLNVQSPNQQLSGFQAINIGTVGFLGGNVTNVNFIPFTDPLF